MPKVRVLAQFVMVRNRRFPGPDPVEYHRGDVFDSEDIEPKELTHLFETWGLKDHTETLGRMLEEHQRDWDAAIIRDPKAKDGMVRDWKNPPYVDKLSYPAVEWARPRADAPIPDGELAAAEARVAELRRQLADADAEIERESHNQLPPRDEHGRFVKES